MRVSRAPLKKGDRRSLFLLFQGEKQGAVLPCLGVVFSASEVSGSMVLRKFNNPKGSKIKNPPKSLNLTEKQRKSSVFLIALIDKLSYNNICGL